jgi:predicted MFS family arabinose efflux permease
LEDSFGLKIAALAGASAVIGLAELSGEGLVAFTTDRLGKPMALGMGLLLNSLSAIALPFLGTTPTGALIGLFFFYITFEYTVVSQLPMMSELMPKARATLLTLNVTGHSLGRVVGAFLSTLIYQNYGFLPAAFGAVVLNGCGLLALLTLQKTQHAAVIGRSGL